MRDFLEGGYNQVSMPEATLPCASGRVGYGHRRFYLVSLKPMLDVALVLLAVPVIVPIILICACLVALEGGNPFYSQSRIGRNGKPFRMWKLRTMVVDAEARLHSYLDSNPEARAEWNKKQKLSDDPRITTLGKVLRKTSLDELPQFFNVLIGDMSLVGPRPMMPEQTTLYAGNSYFRLRPGITGPWQTSVRNKSAFCERVYYDELYWRTVSLGTDIGLLWRTVVVLMRPTGI